VPEYTLRVRRYNPEAADAPYWDEYKVDLEGHRSVLEGLLEAKAKVDGSLAVRCSCRAAICGSCGVQVNGKSTLACHTHLDKAAAHGRDGVIEVEPMANMPVIKDLVTDMEAVHWKKQQRVTPWLINKEPIPEREYIVPHENMVDVTQSMACIQCGACVSSCLSLEVDPLFIGPAALAKAYRFVGDPRDAAQYDRLKDLAEDPHGMYDCTHCFSCIDACPKGVAPMNQIMRLRRIAGDDHHIDDRNNGHRHEKAFVSLVRDHGLLWEAELLPRSYGGDSWFGKFAPAAGAELAQSLPVIVKAMLRRKVTLMGALKPHKIPKPDLKAVQRIYETVGSHEKRNELNLYISGYDEDEVGPGEAGAAVGASTTHAANVPDSGQPGQEPEESPTR
jgi:succinate dehydrogenase / fumarate reductase iron-sulfur subunit